MASTISFGDANSGLEAGVIHGSVNAEFHHHHPPGKLQRLTSRSALVMGLPQNDPKLYQIRQPSYPSLAIKILLSEEVYSTRFSINAPYLVHGLRSSDSAALGKCERFGRYGC